MFTVLVQNRFDASTALFDISKHSACQSGVRVGIDKNFHFEHFPDFFLVEYQNSLNDYHVGVVEVCPACPRVGDVGVGGNLYDWFAGGELLEDLVEELEIECVRVIKVEVTGVCLC